MFLMKRRREQLHNTVHRRICGHFELLRSAVIADRPEAREFAGGSFNR